ncbi:IS66 family transposase [Phormidesmis sp. 146-35]
MDKLPNLKELSSEAKDALIEQLWEKVEALQRQIESRDKPPKKTAQNSSLPSSKGFKANVQPVSGQGVKRQASVGRVGGGRKLHPDPDQVIVAKLKRCPVCEQAITAEQQQLEGRYDKIELPPVQPIVTRIERYSGYCECCQQRFVAPVPAGMESGSPFGRSIESVATYWRYSHALSYQRLSQMFAEVFGLSISEGGLAQLFARVKTRLDAQVEAILSRLQQSRLVCSDETSARVNGQTQWEWVFQNELLCLHVIRPSRGTQVIREVFPEQRPQVWVSDLFSAQKNHPAYQWQVCLAHQLRDCQFAIDAGDQVFAPVMKQLLLRSFVIHKRRERLADSTRYQYRCDLSRRLQKALALEPKQKDGIRLQKRYDKLQDHLFLFLEDATIPPTNNSSEQALRMSVVFRKVTPGFRSDWGRDLFAAVRSVVNTGKRQGLSAFDSIQKALSDNPSLFEPG